MNQEKNYRLCAGKVCVISVNLSNVKGWAFAPTTMSGYAMANAWSLLKALEEHQIRDYVGRNRTALPAGTVPPPIRGMMERRSQPFKIEGPGQAPPVTRPAEAFRDFAGTNPEEGFLSPGYEAGAADDSLAAALRRQVGGQQRGERMTGQRHQTIGTQEGVARGMKLRGGARAFEPETIERETHTPEQLEVMRRNEELGALAAQMGIDFTPQELPPSPEPEEEEPQFRTAGAAARRAGMDERMKEKPFQMTPVDVDPRQAQAMAGGDMGQMDFGPEGQPMMGQEGLRQRLFDIAQQKARQKYRPQAQAGEQSSEIQAMQAELDRRG